MLEAIITYRKRYWIAKALLSVLLRGKRVGCKIYLGTGKGIAQGFVVSQLNAQISADCVELVIHQSGPSPSCRLYCAGERGQGKVDMVILKTVLEDTAVEATVVRNKGIESDESLNFWPCPCKGWCVSHITHPDAVDSGKARDDMHTCRWLDEGIELVDQFSIAYLDQAHSTGTCTLVAGGLKVDGTEVQGIRHG